MPADIQNDAAGNASQLSYPAVGIPQLGTAGGPGVGQTQVILASVMTNPTTSDIPLYTVPSGTNPVSGKAYTFFLTDFVVTGTPSTGNPLVKLKYNTQTTSGAISTGSQTVTLANVSSNVANGATIWVGQTVDIETPNAANYEAVVVTAVQTNTAGTPIGFTATFTKTHAAGIVIGVPLEVSYINSTKGIEEIGIESQPSAPSGSALALNISAFTGGVAYNVRGFIQ
jgi:hypothetical protein